MKYGGVETFVYEIVKKYKNLDIAVVYKTADKNQLKRLRRYCPTYKHNDESIYCKVAIINYDVSIIDYIKEGKIYQVIHGDYENPAYKWKPPTHKRITSYIGITNHICESFKRITGKENIILGYNPLTIESDKPLILISATRLSPIKGKDRMIKLANALDKENVNYIWLIFTNDTEAIDNPNIVYMKPRLNLQGFIKTADYLVQLSDTEACSYAINEALYQNTAIIATKLPYLDEIGVKDGVNSYLMDFDCSNIDYIVKNIKNVPKFKFNQLKDSYGKILQKSKSKYQEYINQKVAVECIQIYDDIKLNKRMKPRDVFYVTLKRAYELVDLGLVKFV